MRLSSSLWLAALLCGCRPTPEPPPEYPPLPPVPAPGPPQAAAKAAPAEPTPAPAPPRRAAVPFEVPPSIAKLVAAADRSEADRALDAGRHPGEFLAFAGAAPGMKVAELLAGGGYTAELLARAVAPKGKVYGVNTPDLLKKFAEKPWSERLAKPVMKNVVRVDRELTDPFPPEAKELDLVVVSLVYHDLVWLGVDRAALNAAVLRALKPGGTYVIVDHTAAPGAGVTQVQTLHRIEESVVRQEIEAAGFRLAAESDFLRNPADTLDWNDSPSAAGDRRGTSDRFAFKFVKP